eukprot:10543768-Prorocentrum_lima.AAC.1
MGKIEGVLPNAGVGLRIEVQPRMNVRLDFGRNFANDQTMDAALAAGKEILNVYNDPSSDFQ